MKRVDPPRQSAVRTGGALTANEYAILLALLVIVLMATLRAVGMATGNVFAQLVTAFTQAGA